MFHKNATLFGKVVTSCRKRRTKGRRSGGSEQRQGAEKQKYGYLKKGNFLILHARVPPTVYNLQLLFIFLFKPV